MILTETDRLILREFHLLDAPAMGAVFGDTEVMRFGSGVKDEEWIQNWLLKRLGDYHQNFGFGLWAVMEKESRELIGYCGLTYFPDICGFPEIEIGYRLRRISWGKGFATEAARAVRDYSTDVLALNRLIAVIDPANSPSIHVAEKLGMIYEMDYMAPDYDHPDLVYAMGSRFPKV